MIRQHFSRLPDKNTLECSAITGKMIYLHKSDVLLFGNARENCQILEIVVTIDENFGESACAKV